MPISREEVLTDLDPRLGSERTGPLPWVPTGPPNAPGLGVRPGDPAIMGLRETGAWIVWDHV